MTDSGNADQNQPFVFKSTIGNFLHSLAFFFMCIALGFAMWWPDNNGTIVAFLFYAMVIHALLAANSRLLFSIFAFLTFGVVLCQFLGFFYSLLTTQVFNGLPTGNFIISLFCILFVFTIIVSSQIFCSVAFLKLSLFTKNCQKPKDQKPRKCRRRRHMKRPSTSESSSEESDKSEKVKKLKEPTSNKSCSSHAPPTCSTIKFTSISSMDSSVKTV